jgi:hypothetical protein
MVEFKQRGGLARYVALAVVGVAETLLGIAAILVGQVVVGAVFVILAILAFYVVFSTYFEAELDSDGTLHFHSLFRHTDTSLPLVASITAYRGGNDRYQFFKIRDHRRTVRLRGRTAGAFVDEVLAAAPTIPVRRKLLAGA